MHTYTQLMILAALALGQVAACQALDSPGVRNTSLVGTFDATHEFEVTVPEGAKKLEAWFAMPQDHDPAQQISGWTVTSPHATLVVSDRDGNEFLYLHAASPAAGTFTVTTRFQVERHEVSSVLDPRATRPHTEAELRALAPYLEDSAEGVTNDAIRKKARKAVGDERNPIRAARMIYDLVLEHVEYHVKDPKPNDAKTMKSSGKGSSLYTFEQCTGNCTDFHSLYSAMTRSVGIPTRVVYGSFFKGPLDGEDRDQSYHCWIEFHAPQVGWIPLDVAVADVFVEGFEANEHSKPRADLTVANGYDGPDPDLVNYYFGNIEERRVVWHRGRDLVMNPPQAGKPLLWNPKCYVEIDGKPSSDTTRKLTYRQVR